MADKNFRVKTGLQVPGVTSANFLSTDSNGTVAAGTTLPISNGGTGQTSANNALNALLPLQTSNDNYFLQTSGISPQWSKVFYQAIKDNGTTVTPRGYLNIVGGTFSDDSTNDITTLTIPTNYVSLAGGSTITTSSASTKGLIIKGAASQTANLQEWQNSAGTVLNRINSAGHLVASSRSIFGGQTSIVSGMIIAAVSQEAAAVPILAKGSASQTADLQEWQNSSGTVLSGVNAAGQLYSGSSSVVQSGAVGLASVTGDGTNATYTATSGYTIANPFIAGAKVTVSGYTGITGYNGTFTIASVGGTSGAYTFTVANTTTGTPGGTGASYQSVDLSLTSENPWATPFIIKGTASQAGNLTEWQNSSGAVVARITAAGSLFTNATINSGTTSSNLGQITSIPVTVGTVGLVIRGLASQTANLTEWQNSAGTVLSYVTSSGSLRAPFLSDINGNGAFIQMNSNSSVTINTRNITNVGLVVFAQPSQTADLQQWQNSAGTVLASISASGNLMVQDLTVNGTTTTINSTTLTVDDKNIELASVTSPTDTTADGAGITIKGATDKTFNWVQSTATFTSSEPISAPAFKSAGTAVSSNITLLSGYRYFVDTTAARTLTLPASPSLGDEIQIFDATGTVFTNNITVSRNGNKINGISDDAIIDINGASAILTYTGSTYGWRFE